MAPERKKSKYRTQVYRLLALPCVNKLIDSHRWLNCPTKLVYPIAHLKARIVNSVFFTVDLQNILMWLSLVLSPKDKGKQLEIHPTEHCASASFPYQATQKNCLIWPLPRSHQQRPKDLVLGIQMTKRFVRTSQYTWGYGAQSAQIPLISLVERRR